MVLVHKMEQLLFCLEMDDNKERKCSKQLITDVIKMKLHNFKDIKVFDSLPLRSLDSINSKPKPLFVCCVVYI